MPNTGVRFDNTQTGYSPAVNICSINYHVSSLHECPAAFILYFAALPTHFVLVATDEAVVVLKGIRKCGLQSTCEV